MEDKRIAFRIEVDDKGAIIGLKSLDKGFKDIDLSAKTATSTAKNLKQAIEQIGGGRTVKNINLTKKEVQELQTSLGGATKATGSATSSVLEFGRVISDAPYGIRGMANNISQLASNLVYTTKAAGGFRKAWVLIKAELAGPLGLLLLIQTVVSALDFFAGSTKKAEEASKDLNAELKSEIRTLKLYEESLRDNNTTLEERVGILKGLSTLDKDLANSLKEAGDNQERLNELTEEYRKKKELELKLNETKTKLDEISSRYDEAALKLSKAQLLVDAASNNRNRISYERKLNLAKGVEEEIRKEQDKTFGEYLILLGQLTDKEVKSKTNATRDKVSSVGQILTAEEEESARLKQAEQVNKLFQDKFKLNEENLKYLKDSALLGLTGIATNEGIAEAERVKIAKDAAEARIEIAKLETERRLMFLDAIGGGLQAMSEIAGEETSAGKALAVAGATIDTYAAIVGQLNAFKGIQIPGYAIAQAVATGVFGFANIKKILAVKVPNGGGGGSTASVPSRTFDFNLVGSTGVNQLAQTVGGQVSQPIKAYVVSSEITNQQQFDNQVQGQITIG